MKGNTAIVLLATLGIAGLVWSQQSVNITRAGALTAESVDTCSGNACNIGPRGFASDGGAYANGLLPNISGNNTSNFQFGAGSASDGQTIHGYCAYLSKDNVGVDVCPAGIIYTWGSTTSQMTLGTTFPQLVLFDGGTNDLKTLLTAANQVTMRGPGGAAAVSGTRLVVDGGIYSGGFGNALLPVPVNTLHDDGGFALEEIEHGRATLSGGSIAVTFHRAFSWPPDCWCTDVGGSALACTPQESTNSTTGITFLGTVNDNIKWYCVGDR